jgi:hypothetical protein
MVLTTGPAAGPWGAVLVRPGAAGDDPRSTEEPTHRGDDGQTGGSVKPRPGSTDLGT